MTEIHFRPASLLAQLIRDKQISSLELTDHFIERIERLDGEINAVVVRDFDRAREAARRADAALAAGRASGPLHGVPFTIKESYNAVGLPTTWGMPVFKDNLAVEDSETVARYRNAGAILLGKTNVPLGLGDFQSYNDIYGTTGNPWDLGRTPGGSSGGAAAAMAAGLSGFESGSDIGGSIRNPAHYCGVYGHKPTWSTFPSQGHALPGQVAGPDIAVCGPLARSAEDLALLLQIGSGPESLDAPGWQLHLPAAAKKSLSEYRVALWPSDDMAPVDSEVAGRTAEIGELLGKLGATVSDTARPDYDIARGHSSYLNLLNSIMGASLPPEQRAAHQATVDAADPEDQSERVLFARGAVLSHRDWIIQNNYREGLRYVWRDFFRDWDILICPQSATPAFPHDQGPIPTRTIEVNGEPQGYFKQLFWAGLVTAPYLPSTVFPTGPSVAGLPIGLQAVGAEYMDRITIDFARLLAEEIGGFQVPPAYA